MKYVFSILAFYLLLSSCTGTKQIIKIKAIESKNDTPEVIAGETIQKQSAKDTLRFSQAGQYRTFKQGEVVLVETEGIDFESNTFSYIYDQETNDVTMILVPREDCKIELNKKCQVMDWNDAVNIPTITVPDNLKPEQIIITPKFNDNCERVGYQIRYGSVERGCYKEAKEVLNKFNKCSGSIKVRKRTPKASGNKTPPTTIPQDIVETIPQ